MVNAALDDYVDPGEEHCEGCAEGLEEPLGVVDHVDCSSANSEQGGEKEDRQVLENEDQLLQERFPLEEVLGASGEEVFRTNLANVQEGVCQ